MKNQCLCKVGGAFSYPPYAILRKFTFEGAAVSILSNYRDKNRPSPGKNSTGNGTLCQSMAEKEPSRKPSVMELLIAVLRHGFVVVAALTKALPVCLIPKQLRIPSVGDDVVNNRCFHQASLLHAPDTEGMCF